MRPRDLAAPAALAGLRAWRAMAGGGVSGGFRILLFHHVPPSSLPAFRSLTRHMAAHHGFLTPQEAMARLDGDRLPPVPVPMGRLPCLLSFDDGFQSNFTLAETVLAEHHIKALFFVCPGLMDLAPGDQATAVNAQILSGVPGDPPPPGLMTWPELARLGDMGHVIGAHSMTHRRLSSLAGRELTAEVVESGARIARELGRPVDWFAYPFGDAAAIGSEGLAAIAQHYRFCRSGVRGINRPGMNPTGLYADHLDLTAAPAWQHLVLEGGLDFHYGAARLTLAALTPHNTPP